MHRFIPAIASWYGVRMSEVKVRHHARRAGESKYGISRTFRVLLDLLTVKSPHQLKANFVDYYSFLKQAVVDSGFRNFDLIPDNLMLDSGKTDRNGELISHMPFNHRRMVLPKLLFWVPSLLGSNRPRSF